MSDTLFIQALRGKYRFDSVQGSLTTEELFDLPLESKRGANLNDVAKAVNKKLKEVQEEDFVAKPTAGNTELQAKLDIVKFVIATKQAENEAARLKADRAAKKERVLELLAKKQDEKLANLSEEELQKLVAEL